MAQQKLKRRSCSGPSVQHLRENPDYTDDDGLTTLYTGLVAKLDPPPAT